MKYTKGLTSIIIPCWMPKGSDKEKYIKWTLDSLNSTTNRLFELLVIDNQSTQKSKKFLKSLIQQFKKNKYCKEIKLIGAKKNLGWTGAWNAGIENSDGENVCIVNDDLILEQFWLSRLLAHLRDDIAAVGPTSNFVSGRQLVKFNIKDSYEEKVNYLIGFCLLIQRKALDDIYENGYYIDPRFYPGGSEELDVCLRLSKAGYDMVIARDVFIHHFGNRSLAYVGEFQQGQNEFYQKRLQLLAEKHSDEWVRVLDSFQHCPKIAIGIPSIGYIDDEFFANYPWLLQDAWSKFDFDNILPIISSRNLIHIGRSEIVRKAIQYGTEFLLFLDNDMLVPADIISRLYAHQKDFISALAYTRIRPYKPCVYSEKDKEGNWMPDVRVKQGLIEVDATGLSCALIKMSVIKNLLRRKQKQIKNRGGLFFHNRFGEDMNFSEELRKVTGIKLFVDSDLVITHLGRRQHVDYRTFFQYLKQQNEVDK